MTDYAGNIDPKEAWELLKSNPAARLIDVRTMAEWSFVGIPDLSALGRQTLCVEWQNFPTMAPNPHFVAEAQSAARGATVDTPLLFLCRSGARSRGAAIAMTAVGFSAAYNIAGGFEGDLDGACHRGGKNGWKAASLPWKQS